MNEIEQRIINALKRFGELNLKQLAEKCEISLPTASKYAWRLEAKGIIKIRQKGTSKVVKLVSFSSKTP